MGTTACDPRPSSPRPPPTPQRFDRLPSLAILPSALPLSLPLLLSLPVRQPSPSAARPLSLPISLFLYLSLSLSIFPYIYISLTPSFSTVRSRFVPRLACVPACAHLRHGRVPGKRLGQQGGDLQVLGELCVAQSRRTSGARCESADDTPKEEKSKRPADRSCSWSWHRAPRRGTTLEEESRMHDEQEPWTSNRSSKAPAAYSCGNRRRTNARPVASCKLDCALSSQVDSCSSEDRADAATNGPACDGGPFSVRATAMAQWSGELTSTAKESDAPARPRGLV